MIAHPERADELLLSWAAEMLGTTTAQLPAYDPARFDQIEINAALLELPTWRREVPAMTGGAGPDPAACRNRLRHR